MVGAVGQERKTRGQEEDAHERERLQDGLAGMVSFQQRLGCIERTIMVRVRRPLVSIRNRVGMVETTWIAPYPREAYRASVAE